MSLFYKKSLRHTREDFINYSPFINIFSIGVWDFLLF